MLRVRRFGVALLSVVAVIDSAADFIAVFVAIKRRERGTLGFGNRTAHNADAYTRAPVSGKIGRMNPTGHMQRDCVVVWGEGN